MGEVVVAIVVATDDFSVAATTNEFIPKLRLKRTIILKESSTEVYPKNN